MEDIKKYRTKFNQIYKEKCMNYKKLPSILPKADRIIVIGDIHGDRSKLLEGLILARLIDNNNWIGGNTIVVQVGDQIDSCNRNMGPIEQCNVIQRSDDIPDDINILYFMTELHKKASKHGGAVYSLVGNHEIMNVTGDMTYVSHQNLSSFDKETGSYIKGREKRIELFQPGNSIANFLACSRQLALVIGSNLFVHGGIIPIIASKYRNINDINMLLTLFLLGELEEPYLFNDLFTSGKTSPLWTRVFGFKINNCDDYLKPLEKIYNVNNIFVGHTPQIKHGITQQCNNRVWMTDIGMSRAFNNPVSKAQVLEILNDNIFNILK
jgi:hypothetical protein